MVETSPGRALGVPESEESEVNYSAAASGYPHSDFDVAGDKRTAFRAVVLGSLRCQRR